MHRLASLVLMAVAGWFASAAMNSITLAGQSVGAPSGHVRLEIFADVTAVVPGQPFSVGVRCRIDPDWHIYWKNPGEAGLATDLRVTAPPGFAVAAEAWPIPERFEQGPGIVGYGYTEEAVFLWRVTPPRTLRGVSRIRLIADGRWLACRKLCVPGQGQAALTLGVGTTSKPANGELFKAARRRLPVPAGEPGTAARVRVEGSIPVSGSAGRFMVELFWSKPMARMEWFPGPAPTLEITDEGVETEFRTNRIRFSARRLAGQPLPAAPLEILAVGVDPSGQRIGVAVEVRLIPQPIKPESKGRVLD